MKVLFAFLVALVFTFPGAASAQSYPTKPVRIMVGYTPGGGVDTTARMVGQALGELWGHTVVIENRPGAAGNLATDDLVYMLNGMGIETGVSLPALGAASAFIGAKLDHPLPSRYAQAVRSPAAP